MPNESEFLVKIRTALEDQGIKLTTEQFDKLAESTKKASSESGEFLDGKHGIHAIGHALNEALPGLAQFTRFFASGFTIAIGAALLAFEFIQSKIEAFSKAIEQLDTGPGARGEWAERMAENVREAAVEEAVFNERLAETRARQNALSETTNRLIDLQRRQAEEARALGDAQRELEVARLELAERLGQITPDEAIRIRLEIDDAAFRRELEAKKAVIQAELAARQHELAASQSGIGGLRDAMDSKQASALATKNAQDKNAAKLAQDKQDLEQLREAQKKMQEGIGLGDFIPKWMEKFAQEGSPINLLASGPDQIASMIAQKQQAVNQEDSKGTALATAAGVAKQQAERAKSDYEEAEKLSAETLRTVQKLQGDLAAAVAQNTALQSIHDQTSAARRASANADIINRVNQGRGTTQDIQQVADWQSQRQAASERGPMAGLDASDVIAAGHTAAANARGHAMSAGEMAEIHGIIQRIIGFQTNMDASVQRHSSQLEETKRMLSDMESRYSINRMGN
jgi:hypothetical protein